jgi:hypothetical protein
MYHMLRLSSNAYFSLPLIFAACGTVLVENFLGQAIYVLFAGLILLRSGSCYSIFIQLIHPALQQSVKQPRSV